MDSQPMHARSSSNDAGSSSPALSDVSEVEVVVDEDGMKPRGRRKHGESASQALATAMAMYDLSDVQTFWDPQLDTKALLAWSKSNVVLAFRGTASFANAWSDLKVGPSDARVHTFVPQWLTSPPEGVSVQYMYHPRNWMLP